MEIAPSFNYLLADQIPVKIQKNLYLCSRKLLPRYKPKYIFDFLFWLVSCYIGVSDIS